MHYEFKPDWDRARERFLAFWNNEIVDRCCVAVFAPKDGAPPREPAEPPKNLEDLERWWLDPEACLQRMLAQFERTFYGGEAYPATTMCVGASAMAAFYGSPVEYRRDTAWYHKNVEDLANFEWTFEPETAPLYRPTFDNTRFYAERVRSRALVGLPELGSPSDDLSLMRGMQDLVMDMMTDPEAVKRAIAALGETWRKAHMELYEIALPCNDGGCPIPWMQTWAPGPHFQMSCDFSTVLSPDMFREFIVPEIRDMMRVNTYSVFHWDGPDELKHLDALLELEDLLAIQWTPGAGAEPTGDPRWFPYYRRIQDAGKRLILPFVEPGEIEAIMQACSSRGLFMVSHAPDESAARGVLKQVERLTHD